MPILLLGLFVCLFVRLFVCSDHHYFQIGACSNSSKPHRRGSQSIPLSCYQQAAAARIQFHFFCCWEQVHIFFIAPLIPKFCYFVDFIRILRSPEYTNVFVSQRVVAICLLKKNTGDGFFLIFQINLSRADMEKSSYFDFRGAWAFAFAIS